MKSRVRFHRKQISPISANSPKYCPYHEGTSQGEKESDKIIIWTPPVCQPLLPETGFELPKCGLRVFSGEIQISSSRWGCA